ncbi:MAG: hypothetical protein ABFR97_11180 [Thermodesulfobacteriota bacterium]
MKKLTVKSLFAVFAVSILLVGCGGGDTLAVKDDGLLYYGDEVVYKKVPTSKHRQHAAGDCHPDETGNYFICAHPHED